MVEQLCLLETMPNSMQNVLGAHGSTLLGVGGRRRVLDCFDRSIAGNVQARQDCDENTRTKMLIGNPAMQP